VYALDQKTYSGFSCPHLPLNSEFVELLVAEHARQALEVFVGRNNASLNARGGGLVDTLSNWNPGQNSFDTVWDLAFGEMIASLSSGTQFDISSSGAAVALRLHASGHTGEWEIDCEHPVRYTFDRWLLPAGEAIKVFADGEGVSVRTRLEGVTQQTKFSRDADGWNVTTNNTMLPVVNYQNIRWSILSGDYLSRSSRVNLLGTAQIDADVSGAGQNSDRLKETGGAALCLIDEFANTYLSWVRRVVRNLVPLPASPGMFNSASGNLLPGTISVSNQTNACALAEMLVHEATHQYLYVLKRLGPIDDGTDETLYFSPFKNKGRPLTYIVFAYHAFGNILLFYRETRKNGLPPDEMPNNIDKYMSELLLKLRQLEQVLANATALTALGSGLWEPLRQQLHAT
jgi:hypothetical protein